MTNISASTLCLAYSQIHTSSPNGPQTIDEARKHATFLRDFLSFFSADQPILGGFLGQVDQILTRLEPANGSTLQPDDKAVINCLFQGAKKYFDRLQTIYNKAKELDPAESQKPLELIARAGLTRDPDKVALLYKPSDLEQMIKDHQALSASETVLEPSDLAKALSITDYDGTNSHSVTIPSEQQSFVPQKSPFATIAPNEIADLDQVVMWQGEAFEKWDITQCLRELGLQNFADGHRRQIKGSNDTSSTLEGVTVSIHKDPNNGNLMTLRIAGLSTFNPDGILHQGATDKRQASSVINSSGGKNYYIGKHGDGAKNAAKNLLDNGASSIRFGSANWTLDCNASSNNMKQAYANCFTRQLSISNTPIDGAFVDVVIDLKTEKGARLASSIDENLASAINSYYYPGNPNFSGKSGLRFETADSEIIVHSPENRERGGIFYLGQLVADSIQLRGITVNLRQPDEKSVFSQAGRGRGEQHGIGDEYEKAAHELFSRVMDSVLIGASPTYRPAPTQIPEEVRNRTMMLLHFLNKQSVCFRDSEDHHIDQFNKMVYAGKRPSSHPLGYLVDIIFENYFPDSTALDYRHHKAADLPKAYKMLVQSNKGVHGFVCLYDDQNLQIPAKPLSKTPVEITKINILKKVMEMIGAKGISLRANHDTPVYVYDGSSNDTVDKELKTDNDMMHYRSASGTDYRETTKDLENLHARLSHESTWISRQALQGDDLIHLLDRWAEKFCTDGLGDDLIIKRYNKQKNSSEMTDLKMLWTRLSQPLPNNEDIWAIKAASLA